MASQRPITIGAFVESLTRHFPGALPQTGSSINGEVASITVWEFHLHGTLITRKVSHSDVVGEINLGFWQKQEDRARRPTKRRELRTSDTIEMEEFVAWCAEWVTGVLHVLSVAFEAREDPDNQAIKPGLSGLLDEGD